MGAALSDTLMPPELVCGDVACDLWKRARRDAVLVENVAQLESNIQRVANPWCKITIAHNDLTVAFEMLGMICKSYVNAKWVWLNDGLISNIKIIVPSMKTISNGKLCNLLNDPSREVWGFTKIGIDKFHAFYVDQQASINKEGEEKKVAPILVIRATLILLAEATVRTTLPF